MKGHPASKSPLWLFSVVSEAVMSSSPSTPSSSMDRPASQPRVAARRSPLVLG